MKFNLYITTFISALFLLNQNATAQDYTFDWSGSAQGIFESGVYEDSNCEALSIATTSTGNVVYSGIVEGKVDMDPNPSQNNTFFIETEDHPVTGHKDEGFVSQLNEDGLFFWAKRFYSEEGYVYSGVQKVLVGADQKMFAIGTVGGDLKIGINGSDADLNLTGDHLFVARMNANGAVEWVKTLAGFNIRFRDAEIANDGTISVVCVSHSPVIDTDTDQNLSEIEFPHSCYFKMDDDGTVLWSGGNEVNGFFQHVDIDASGNMYFAGQFDQEYVNSPDLDPGAGTVNVQSDGAMDLFVMKLNSSGVLQWHFTLGTPNQDTMTDFELDADDNPVFFMLNSSQNMWDVDPGSGTAMVQPNQNILMKFNGEGEFQWFSQIFSDGNLIAIDENNLVHIVDNASSPFSSSMSFIDENGDALNEFIQASNIQMRDINFGYLQRVQLAGYVSVNYDADPSEDSSFLVEGPGAFVTQWNPPAPQVQFAQGSFNVEEDEGTITIQVDLPSAQPFNHLIEVSFSGTANSGSDYTSSIGTEDAEVFITAGQASVSFTIEIEDDLTIEDSETIIINMTGTSEGIEPGTISQVTITIEDNDFVSVSESEISGIKVYPNPSRGHVFIQGSTEVSEIEIFHADGKLYQSLQLIGERNEIFLPTGVYIVRHKSFDQIEHTKLIVE